MTPAMRRRLVWAGTVPGAVLALATGLAWLLGATETGFKWVVATVNAAPFTKVRIHVSDARGTLVGGFSVGEVQVATAHVDVGVQSITGAADFWQLVSGSVAVNKLTVGRVRVVVHRVQASSTAPPRFLPRLLRLRVSSLDARDVDIALANGTHLSYDRVAAAARLTSDRIAVSSFEAHGALVSGNGHVTLFATRPIALDADVEWQLTPARQPAWRGTAALKGDLDRLAYGAEIAAPFHGSSRGELTTLTGNWNWHGALAIADFDVRAWKKDSNLGPASAALDVGGNRDGYRASGTVTPRDLATGPLRVRYRGRYHERTVFFDELAVGAQSAPGELRARGTIALTGAAPRLDFSAEWDKLQWPVRGAAAVVSDHGHGSLAGDWPLHWEAEANVRVRDLPAADVNARGELATGRITLADAHGAWLQGELTANGEVHFGEHGGWSVNAQGTRLNPASWRKDWPGALDASIHASAASLKPDAEWQVDVYHVRGRLRNQRLAASGSLRRFDQGIAFDRVALDLGSTHVRLDGSVGQEIALRWSVTSPDLARTIPGAAGRLDSSGRFQGRGEKFAVSGHLDAAGLKYADFSARRVLADLDVDLTSNAPSRATVSAEALAWAERSLETLHFELAGTGDSHDWRLDARAADTQMKLGGHARYSPGLWTAMLEQWTLDGTDGPHLKLAAPAGLTIGRGQLSLSPACLVAEPERLCAQGNLDTTGIWQIKAWAERLPLKALGPGLPGRPEFDGSLAMQIAASGSPESPWTGTGRVDLSDAALHYRLQRGQLETLTLGEGHAEFLAEPAGFSGKMKVRATEKTFVDADVALTRLPGRELKDQSLTGSLHAQVSELGLIPLFLTEVDRVDGSLAAELKLAGTPRAPNIDGTLGLDARAIDLYQVNLQLRDTKLAARLSGNSLALDGTTHAGAGQATIQGNLAWNGALPSGALKLTGENLQIVNVPEVRIVASPDLALRIDGRRIDVDGAVTVPYARFAPVELTGAVLPSSDEVLIGARVTPPEERFQVYTRLRLALGDDVRIETYGLAGKLSGRVMTSSSPGDPGTGVGELKVDEGKYTVLARRLDIERGRLLFNGGPLSNPGIDIRAVKRLPDIVAGANVRGTLREPTLSFFSEPPISQTQIVSLLVAGGTLESLQSNQTQQVGSARAELLAQGGAILASQLGAQLGLEDVTVESNQLNQTSLVLGKYLSPRLYVSYGVSLTEAINTLKLQYTLGDRWTIRTEAGENRSADIFFTIEK